MGRAEHRRLGVTLLTAVMSVVLALSACSGPGASPPGPRGAATSGSASAPVAASPAPPPPPPSPVPAEARALSGYGGSAPLPAPPAVAAALAGPLGAPGLGPPAAVHALIVDAATGTTLLDRGAEVAAPPASTVKILTAAAALRVLGGSTRLRTTVVTSARLLPGGELRGDLVLVGAGDPTLTVGAGTAVAPGQATVAALAASVRAAGVRRVVGRVVGDGSLFPGPTTDPGWLPGYVTGGSVAPVSALAVDGGRYAPSREPAPRVADPPLAAAASLERAMRAAGVAFTLEAVAGVARPGSREIGAVEGLPVAALVARMLTDSDNDLAESLGRLVSAAAGGTADATGAVAAVLAAVTTAGVDVARATLDDTSGLSTRDRLPATALVTVLRLAVGPGHPELRPLALGLPVAGRSGTLAERFRTAPARLGYSRVHAKTGALAGVSTLAGYVVGGGRLLVFSFGTEAAVTRGDAEAALDRAAAALTQLP